MLKHIIIAVMLILVCICLSSASTIYASDIEITATEETMPETTDIVTDNNEVSGYIIVILAAIFGSLVSLAIWHILGV